MATLWIIIEELHFNLKVQGNKPIKIKQIEMKIEKGIFFILGAWK